MFDCRSGLTAGLRQAARMLKPENWIRQRLSATWDWVLGQTGQFVTVPLAGRPIRVQVAFRHIDPNYEADALRVWLRLIRPGDTVWDVGAHLGLYALLAGQAVGPTGTVVAWEPAPGTYRVLRNHITANQLDGRCQAFQGAIAATNGGTVPFLLLPGNELNSMNRMAGPTAETKVEVPVGTLDGWLDRLRRPPGLVKIDIEGAEVLALRGAARLLAPEGTRPVLLVSVHPGALAEFECSTKDLPPLLEQYQYECRGLDGRPARPEKLAEYLFLPRERADAILTQMFS